MHVNNTLSQRISICHVAHRPLSVPIGTLYVLWWYFHLLSRIFVFNVHLRLTIAQPTNRALPYPKHNFLHIFPTHFFFYSSFILCACLVFLHIESKKKNVIASMFVRNVLTLYVQVVFNFYTWLNISKKRDLILCKSDHCSTPTFQLSTFSISFSLWFLSALSFFPFRKNEKKLQEFTALSFNGNSILIFDLHFFLLCHFLSPFHLFVTKRIVFVRIFSALSGGVIKETDQATQTCPNNSLLFFSCNLKKKKNRNYIHPSLCHWCGSYDNIFNGHNWHNFSRFA